MADLDGRQRTRTEEQKRRRRESILEVGWRLFQERPYDAITMALVAERAGLAKGTPYQVDPPRVQHYGDRPAPRSKRSRVSAGRAGTNRPSPLRTPVDEE
jgi:hypothetical protein